VQDLIPPYLMLPLLPIVHLTTLQALCLAYYCERDCDYNILANFEQDLELMSTPASVVHVGKNLACGREFKVPTEVKIF